MEFCFFSLLVRLVSWHFSQKHLSIYVWVTSKKPSVKSECVSNERKIYKIQIFGICIFIQCGSTMLARWEAHKCIYSYLDLDLPILWLWSSSIFLLHCIILDFHRFKSSLTFGWLDLALTRSLMSFAKIN